MTDSNKGLTPPKTAREWIEKDLSHVSILLLAMITTGVTAFAICTLNQLPTWLSWAAVPLSCLVPLSILLFTYHRGEHAVLSFNDWIDSSTLYIVDLLVSWFLALVWLIETDGDEYKGEMFIVIFAGLCTFVGMLILVLLAIRHAKDSYRKARTSAVGNPDGDTQGIDSPAGLEVLHVTVLLLGVTAGVTIGFLVGIEGMRRLYVDNPHPTLYQKITESFATGIVSGTLIAVFVAVGCLVFVFERKMSHFDTNAYELLMRLKGITETVRQLESEVKQRTGDLVNILHTNLGVEQLGAGIKHELVSPEAWYLSSWFRKIGSLRDESLVAGCAIARSYWCEEAFDIGHWQLVTNSRNYAAFLISVVERLLLNEQRGKKRKVYFYTSTPVAPFFLLNMPLEIRSDLTLHGQARFLDEYMSFVRDAVHVHKDKLVHRRFIWSASIGADRKMAKLPGSFSDWFHYPFGKGYSMEGREEQKVLGVPILLGRLASNEELFDVRSLDCKDGGRCQGSVRGELEIKSVVASLRRAHSDLGQTDLRAFPLLVKGASDNDALQRVIRAELNELKDALDHCFGRVEGPLRTEEARKALKGDPAGDVWDELVRDMPAIRNGQWRTLPPAYRIIECVQALGAVAAARELPVGSISAFEDVLLRAKWWQYWKDRYSDGTVAELPTFKTFFDAAFHSEVADSVGPQFVSSEPLAKEADSEKGKGIWNIFDEIGPEFALVGVEGDPSDNKQETIEWIAALRSSIAQPWTSGEIRIFFKDSKQEGHGSAEFAKFEEAMNYLIKNGRPT